MDFGSKVFILALPVPKTRLLEPDRAGLCAAGPLFQGLSTGIVKGIQAALKTNLRRHRCRQAVTERKQARGRKGRLTRWPTG